MEKVKPFLSRALVAFLFALGLTLPVLGALNLMGAALPCVALLIGLCAVLTAASMNRKVGLAVLIASVAGLAIYLLALGGIQTIREAVIGVILQLSGVQGALPMVAGPCAILLTLIFGLLCWALTSPGAGFYPGLAVLLLVMMILWLTSRTNLLLYTLPGLAALVVLFVQSSHEHIPLARILPIAVLAVGLSFPPDPRQRRTSPALQKTGAGHSSADFRLLLLHRAAQRVHAGQRGLLSSGHDPAGRPRGAHGSSGHAGAHASARAAARCGHE